jgi:hypothetical protein
MNAAIALAPGCSKAPLMKRKRHECAKHLGPTNKRLTRFVGNVKTNSPLLIRFRHLYFCPGKRIIDTRQAVSELCGNTQRQRSWPGS